MRTARRSALIGLVLTAGGASAQSVPEGYTLVELAPLTGGSESFVSSINDRGEIAGRTEFGTGPIATRWDRSGAAALITVSGGAATDAVSINNEGLMLVACDGCGAGGGALTGVRLLDGTLLELPAPSAPGSVSRSGGITDSGAVGGLLTEPDPQSSSTIFSGVVWELGPGPAMVPRVYGPVSVDNKFAGTTGGMLSNAGKQLFGRFSAFGGSFILADARTGALGGGGGDDESTPIAVNAVGQYTGIAEGGFTKRSLFYEPDGTGTLFQPVGCMGDFDCFVFAAVSPTAMNDAGLVVGVSEIVGYSNGFPSASIGTAAFVWSRDTGAVDLADLIVDGSGDGWSLNSGDQGPADINEAGFIVGNGVNPDGDPAAYVLIPRSPCAADTNRDGDVTPADYNAWILSFNNGCD